MTAGTAVNTGQIELQELQQGERNQRIFHMQPSKAQFVFTLFVLIFTVADCVLPLAFSSYCYDYNYYGGYPNYDCGHHNYIIIYIGAPIAVVIGIIFLVTSNPSVLLCVLYLLGQVIGAILIVIANIIFISDYAYIGQTIGVIIINICYFILLILELMVVLHLIRQRRVAKRNARAGQEIRVIAQGQAYAAPPPRPPAPVTVAPPTSAASGPVTTTTVITTYNATPGQPVIIPPGIPAIHGIPPGPLNPAALSNNQVYARTTSNMYPTVPQMGQMAPVAPVAPIQTTVFATAPVTDNMLPSAPPQLYDYPPEVTVATVHYQNTANPEESTEQYDMPPGLVDDNEEPALERPESPSPSDFSEVPSSSYEAPPEEGPSSSIEAPQPLPRKTRPSDMGDAPSVDKYEAPPVEDDETPIFM